MKAKRSRLWVVGTLWIFLGLLVDGHTPCRAVAQPQTPLAGALVIPLEETMGVCERIPKDEAKDTPRIICHYAHHPFLPLGETGLELRERNQGAY
jgi:hypothetical protein